MKSNTRLIFLNLTVLFVAGCSVLGIETQTPLDRSWSLMSQYPTETPVACKTGVHWAQIANDLGTDIGIAESIWFKESDLAGWEYGWLRENELGIFFLSYNNNENGCIVEAHGGSFVTDLGNDAASELGAFVITVVQDYFDQTFDYDSIEPVGETDKFINEVLDNCHGEEFKASFVDTTGNTWLMNCGAYQVEMKGGLMLSIQYQSK